MNFPSKISAGLDFSASLTDGSHPGPAWTISAVLRGPASINLTASSDGASHAFAVPGSTTASWSAGLYAYSIRATDGSAVVGLGDGQLTVIPNLAAVSVPYDARSDNEKALEAVRAVLEKRASLDQERYKINNRELWRTPVNDLLKLKSFYESAVRRERMRGNGCNTFGRQIPVRFKS